MRLFLDVVLALCLAAVLFAAPAGAQSLPGIGGGGGNGDGETSGEAAADDPVALLLDILRDEDARAELVQRLEGVEASATGEAAAQPEEPRTIGQRIADVSEEAALGVLAEGQRIVRILSRAPNALTGLSAAEAGVILDALRQLALTVALTVGLMLFLQAAARPLFRRMGASARTHSAIGRVVLFVAAGLIDFGIVAVAWAVGNATALLLGESGEIEYIQVLYLNAFLAVEMLKTAVRLVLSPATGDFRPIHLSDWAARRLYRVIRITASVAGYSILLVLPIVAENAGYAAGRSTGIVIWSLVAAFLALTVVHYRWPVGAWLSRQMGAPRRQRAAENGETPADDEPRRATGVHAITHAWYVIALIWIAWLLLTVLGRSAQAVTEFLVRTGHVAVAFAAAVVALGLLGRLVERGIPLPEGVRRSVPPLEERLNTHVPRIVLLVRIAIAVTFVLYALDTLGVANLGGWIVRRFGLGLTDIVLSSVLVLLVGFVAWLALTSWVDYRLNPDVGDQPTSREQTLLTLMRNAATIAILVLTLMFVLSEIGLNIGPLLASAGVVGLAIGFGAQKLVQDIINGVFIQFENAINVGDVVAVGGVTGAVERLTVRSVSLRDLAGIYHIIPFSSVDTVSNYTRDFSYYVVDMGVAYRERVPEVREAMHDAFSELRADPETGAFILGDLEWFGVDAFGDHSVVVKCRIKTWPGQQWTVGRAYNEIVKRIFDERDIEIPFPQQSMWFGQDKDGRAAPLRLSDPDGRTLSGGPPPRPDST